MSSPFRTAVVGLGKPGLHHALCLFSQFADFQLVGGCDPSNEARTAFNAELPKIPAFGSLRELLEKTHPEIVVLATNETPRCRLALEAVEAGVRGLFVEKPMAVGFGDALRLTEICEQRDVPLVVNHQRRTLPVFRTMRRLIEEGAIGEVRLIRASCAGDLISDGTHLINTVNFLFQEAKALWASGMIDILPKTPMKSYETFTGTRSGHRVEYGSFGLVEYATGQRAEFYVGSMQLSGTKYQTYEVVGSRGTLRRDGDSAEPPLLMQHETHAGWTPVSLDIPPNYVPPNSLAVAENYQSFARVLRGEMLLSEHPLNARSALACHEILSAIYESARLRDRVMFPLTQSEFPLELLLREASA